MSIPSKLSCSWPLPPGGKLCTESAFQYRIWLKAVILVRYYTICDVWSWLKIAEQTFNIWLFVLLVSLLQLTFIQTKIKTNVVGLGHLFLGWVYFVKQSGQVSTSLEKIHWPKTKWVPAFPQFQCCFPERFWCASDFPATQHWNWGKGGGGGDGMGNKSQETIIISFAILVSSL